MRGLKASFAQISQKAYSTSSFDRYSVRDKDNTYEVCRSSFKIRNALSDVLIEGFARKISPQCQSLMKTTKMRRNPEILNLDTRE